MFVAADENTVEIAKLINKSKKIDCAVAFLGGKAPEILGKKGGRIICNLDSNGTNPNAVETLIAEKKFEVKKLSDLHAKIYIGDAYGIVSSSNLSANGLGLEDDEVNGWREAGYKVTNNNEISRMREWFEVLWNDASVISEKDINLAKSKWLEHRKNRPFQTSQKKKSFLEELKLDPSRFQDRNIYLTITSTRMTKSAEKEVADINESIKSPNKIITAYEDWPNLPKGAFLIDLFIQRGESAKLSHAEFLEVCETPNENDNLNSKKTKNNLLLCYKRNNICGFEITKSDEKKLKSKVMELWSAGIGEGEADEDYRLIKLEDAFEILIR